MFWVVFWTGISIKVFLRLVFWTGLSIKVLEGLGQARFPKWENSLGGCRYVFCKVCGRTGISIKIDYQKSSMTSVKQDFLSGENDFGVVDMCFV